MMDPSNNSTTPGQDPQEGSSNNDLALDILRKKLDQIYSDEPSAEKELEEISYIQSHQPKTVHPQTNSNETETTHVLSRSAQIKRYYQRNHSNTQRVTAPSDQRAQEPSMTRQTPHPSGHSLRLYEPALSKHQQYMLGLKNSGKSTEEIQTAWHEYYTNLSDKEKHEVWAEFNQNAKNIEQKGKGNTPNSTLTTPEAKYFSDEKLPDQNTQQTEKNIDQRSLSDIKKQLLDTMDVRDKRSRKHTMKSIAFGLSMGCFALLIMSFGFFNERFIAPFMTPSKAIIDTPVILERAVEADGPAPKVIIPKINTEAPVVFDEKSIDEDIVQKALESGVLHYGITPYPGERGNTTLFGHSSGNLFTPGDYKFIFSLLNALEDGDLFMIQRDGVRYVYKVFDKKVVPPSAVEVLNPHPEIDSVATLITCDPPGLRTNRLIVVGEQISPDPAENSVSDLEAVGTEAIPDNTELASDSLTLWQRIKRWFSNLFSRDASTDNLLGCKNKLPGGVAKLPTADIRRISV